MAKLFFPSLIILGILIQSCGRYPPAPNYAGIGNCGSPTIPSNLQFKDSVQYASSLIGIPESTRYYQFYEYFEIYNYEKQLINGAFINLAFNNFATYGQLHSSSLNNFSNIYWNGTDMNGKKVDNGTYTFKATSISQVDTNCSCGTIILTTN